MTNKIKNKNKIYELLKSDTFHGFCIQGMTTFHMQKTVRINYNYLQNVNDKKPVLLCPKVHSNKSCSNDKNKRIKQNSLVSVWTNMSFTLLYSKEPSKHLRKP